MVWITTNGIYRLSLCAALSGRGGFLGFIPPGFHPGLVCSAPFGTQGIYISILEYPGLSRDGMIKT